MEFGRIVIAASFPIDTFVEAEVIGPQSGEGTVMPLNEMLQLLIVPISAGPRSNTLNFQLPFGLMVPPAIAPKVVLVETRQDETVTGQGLNVPVKGAVPDESEFAP